MTRTGSTNAFTIALLAALCLHAVVILAVNFDYLRDRVQSVPTSLDVILVEWASEEPPEEADFLAQAAQRGGGESPTRERPTEPAAAAEPVTEPQPEEARPAEPESASDTESGEPAESPLLTSTDAAEALPARESESDPEEETVPDAGQLVNESLALARMMRDPISEARSAPERPRRKFISANTQEHVYAAYMRNWVAKVERVGNLNYPEAARRANLDGSLMLRVDVHQDGSVERIDLLRSSGYEVLDEAAVRIVRLAAPFAPLPPQVAAEVDILTITRTWQFSSKRGLR